MSDFKSIAQSIKEALEVFDDKEHQRLVLQRLLRVAFPAPDDTTVVREQQREGPRTQKASSKTRNSLKKPKRAKTAVLSRVPDLDLDGGNDKPSLHDFHQDKRPASAPKRNVVFVYYLSTVMGRPKVSANHVFECYKRLGVAPPKDLVQTLYETAARNRWLDTSDIQDIKLTQRGVGVVEKKLPLKSAKRGESK